MNESRAVTDSHPAFAAEQSSGSDIWRSLVTAVRGAFGTPQVADVAIGRAGDSPTRTMQMAKFEELRAGMQANASPSAPAQLLLMENALRDRLVASGLFLDVEVDHTDEPDRLLIALCHFGHEHTEEEIADRVAEIWDTKVRYQFWAAHATEIEEDFVELQGATRPDATGRYVTVQLIAQRAGLPVQRKPS